MKKRKPLNRRLLSILAAVMLLMPTTLLVAPVPVVQATDTGWQSPTADMVWPGGDGDGFEEYPTDAYTSGGGYARNWDGSDDRHVYQNFGFDSLIPPDAVIAGIEIRLDGWADSTANDPRYGVALSWNGGSSGTSDHFTSVLGDSQDTFYLGGPSDLWGHSWSASELNDENLLVRITSTASGVGREDRDFFLDWVAVRVYYAAAHIGGTIWSDDNANGEQDGTEAGLENVHVTIYQDDGDGIFEGGSQDSEVGSDDTDADGVYDTGPFMDGYSYWVDVDEPANHDLTTPPEPRLVNLPDNNSVTVNFGYELEITTHPEVEISKTPDTQMVVSGSTVTFTIAVTNTGDVTLTNVTVSDALVPDCVADLGTMTAPASSSYTCNLTNVTDDFVNTATVTGTPPAGDDVIDADTASVNVINPSIEIAKTPDSQTVITGTTAYFTIAVTNTGDITLTNVTVSDALAPNCARAIDDLGPGEGTSYGCSRANITVDFINSASASGTPPVGPDVTDTDTAEVMLDKTTTCPDSMFAYWKLDETSGSIFDDFYDGHDGQCAGVCPTSTAGQTNGGQEFNGSTTGVDVPTVPGDDSLNWSLNDSFSIEFWMKADSAHICSVNNEVIVGRDDSPHSQLHWWVGVGCGSWANGSAAFVLRDNGGDIAYVLGSTDLTDGSWYHVVAVRDASANEIRIYVDGAEEGLMSATYTADFDSPTAALNIGWLNLSHGYHFDGTADEVALYNRALSTTEIRQHYHEGLAGRWYCQSGTYAPIIVSTPALDAIVGHPYTYNVEAIGEPDPTYALLTQPAGMTIDPTTGLISWTPSSGQEGYHNVEVQASNSTDTDIQSFSITALDMIAHWKLDETSGTTYQDAHDGHDGTCGSQCPSPTTGYVNGAQRFDGINSEINVSADGDFNWSSTGSFAAEFWLQTDSASTCSGNQVVIGRDDSATDLHWWVGCQNGGQAAFSLIDNGGTSAWLMGTTDLTDGLWHHVLAIRDANANEIRIYVDGAQEGSTSTAYTHGFDSWTATINIGWLNLSSGFHFDGIVDEVALYAYNVTPSPGDERIYLPIVLKN